MSAQPTQAAWQIDVVRTGTWKSTTGGEEQIYNLDSDFGGECVNMTWWYNDSGNPVSSEMNATFTIKATWVANGPNDKPPVKNWFKVKAFTFAQGDGDGGSDDSDMPDGFENIHDEYGTPCGEKIIEKGEGTEHDLGTYTINPTATAIADNDFGFWTYYATAYCYMGAEVADFSLRISRGGGKSEDDPTLKKDRDNWVEKDGSGHGHTLASYLERIETYSATDRLGAETEGKLVQDDPRDVVQTIVASRGGSWSPEQYLDWTWSPSNSTDTIRAHSQSMTQHNAINNPEGISRNIMGGSGENYAGEGPTLPGWINTPAAQGDTIDFTYNLKDKVYKDVDETAKYQLTLHDEWEKPIADPRFGSGGFDTEEIYIVPEGAVTAVPNDQSTWTMENTQGFSVTLGSSFTGGFKLGDWGNAQGSLEVERKFDKEWKITSGAAKMTDAPYSAANGTYDRFLSVIVFQAKRVHKLVQHWGADGYIADPSTTDACTPTFDGFDPKSDEWGRTPQSKVEDLTAPRADWQWFTTGSSLPFGTSGHFESYVAPSGGSS